MEVVELQIFQFHELDEQAKRKAREWHRQDIEYPWFDEAKDSLKAFCDHFRVTVKDWRLGDNQGYVKTDAEQRHFRGVKLSEQDRDAMPTGLWLDCELFMHFYDEFKRTGDAKSAFDDALHNFVKAVERDVEHFYSDESVDEHIETNMWTFTADGKYYPYWNNYDKS
jgi:hypothetical protein